jgi:hypothetical protein
VVAAATEPLVVRAEALLGLAGLTQIHMLVVAGLQIKVLMVLSVLITHITAVLAVAVVVVGIPAQALRVVLALYLQSLGLLPTTAVAVVVRVITMLAAGVELELVVLAAVEPVLVGMAHLLRVQQIQAVRVAALIRGKELPQQVVLV